MGSKIYTKTDERAGTKPAHTTKKHAKTTKKQSGGELKPHPAAQIFPRMKNGALAAFTADIEANGQLEPIVVHDGLILDGRNRHAACMSLGIEPIVRTFGSQPSDGDDPLAFVISENVHRRHLNETQRAVIASKLATIRDGVRSDRCANLRTHTQDEAADMLGVSRRSVQYARVAREHGLPDLVVAIEDGTLPVSKAATIARLDNQADVIRRADLANADNQKRAIQSALFGLKKEAIAAQAAQSPERAVVRRDDAVRFLRACEPFDLLLTDPPYSTDVDDIETFAEWLAVALSKLKPTGRAYVCVGAYPRELLAYLEVLRGLDLVDRSQVLSWTYRNTIGPSPSHDYKLNWQAILYVKGAAAPPLDCPIKVEQFSVQDINAPDGRLGDRYHGWQKPDALGERFVRHGTAPGALVVDPFCCTGTFLLAAARLGRRAIGCDISAENLKIAEQRGCQIEVA